MMQIMTDEEIVAARDAQIEIVTRSIRTVLLLHPTTEPEALTMMLNLCGNNASILGPNDLAAARIAAKKTGTDDESTLSGRAAQWQTLDATGG